MASTNPHSEFEFRRIHCGEVTLHVAQVGKGTPVIFLHGFPEHWRAFAPIMVRLSADFRCIAPDQRGYGFSDRPALTEAYHIDHLADDIAGLVRALDLGKVDIIAHDWGGLVAWHFAGRHADLLRRLIIFNAPHPYCLRRALDQDSTQRAASTYAKGFASPGAHMALAGQDPLVLWAAFFGQDEKRGWVDASDKAAILEAWSQKNSWEAMLNWYVASGFDFIGDPHARRPIPPPITAPTLLIWGDKDPLFTSSCLTGLDDIIVDLTLKTIVGGGPCDNRDAVF